MEQMEKHGIPASITMAQGILESASGTSDLALKANNHFGIKCHKDWAGKKFYKDDDKKNECFRVYDNAEASFDDHSVFLKRDRYASLFQLDITDYKGWAKGLKECGYATNPQYPQLLIALIEKHRLYELDQGIEAVSQLDDLKKKTSRTILVVHKNNRYILAAKGDTEESLTKELQLGSWQLRKYNDLDVQMFQPGDKIYLQKKRIWVKEKGITTDQNTTLWRISQDQCISLKKIAKLNGLKRQSAVNKGDFIKFKK